jgi:hypothetical protein
MYAPEAEKDDEEMVDGPESLIVGSTRFLDRGEEHGHQGEEHDVSRPARARSEVGEEETFEAKVGLGGKLGKIVPVCYGVDPGEENERVCDDYSLRVKTSMGDVAGITYAYGS